MRSHAPAVMCATAVIWLAGCREVIDPTVKETPVTIVEDHPGVGSPVKAGDLVTINYRITTEAGDELLRETGYKFIIGSGAVILGVEDAVIGMRVSGDRTVLCPPHRHWGRGGYGNGLVPANATLTFHIELEAKD